MTEDQSRSRSTTTLTSGRSSIRRARASIPERIALPEWIPAEPFHAWVEMRARMRRPLTPYAIGLAVKRLALLRAEGEDVAQVLDQSTMMGWAGLFREKKADGNGSVLRNGHDALEDIKRGRR